MMVSTLEEILMHDGLPPLAGPVQDRPLGGRPLAETHSPREIRNAVDALTHEHHELALREGHSVNGTADGLQLGPLGLVHVAYGAPVIVDSPPSGRQVVIVLPLGPMGVHSNGHEWIARGPFALSSLHGTKMAPDPRAGALVGSAAADVVEDYVERLQSKPLRLPIALSSEVPLKLASPGLVEAAWLEACGALGSSSERPEDITVNALVSSLLSTMVLGLAPHLSASIGPSPRMIEGPSKALWRGPGYLIAARNLMQAHLAESLSVDDIASAVGVSSRQLHAAFAEHLGTSPAQLLRDMRLDRARSLLLDRSLAGRLTVATVAARTGFSHFGRFAAYYVEKFGEAPSVTLTRTRH
ncbi:helix-turn-helix transcriptional regulator [Sinomonas sp. ASV322]|uniref:helix-turn-helix transcriptional regulator n=1 Tax=Sinomonas sp. ASV322 TaxID=3041920 RepID=UPI0027DD0045|nr:helix-turn-helix transcriptional regulator [Sinomonas sp. ASV322]MDQ4503213.1 helix-turn-helix transcriptional regulator [Sinomonas sp. ASV322]